MKKLLSVRHLKKYFPLSGKGIFHSGVRYLRANDDISLDIYAGETFGLVGESGCGKSTFGRVILQLLPQTAGSTVYYGRDENGIDLPKLSPAEMRPLRQDLQIIFQDPYSSLNPRMTVGQILEEGPLTHGMYRRGDPALREHILRVTEECGLQEFMLSRYPHQFSGGQRQRISIARSLAVHPKFIVCDECVSALDVSIQSQILNLLQDLKERERLTYLFISHNLSVVRYLSDRIGVMYLGKMVEVAPTDLLFAHPAHPYTAALLSAVPTTDPESDTSRKELLRGGNLPDPADPPDGCPFHPRCPQACDRCRKEKPPLSEISPGHFAACHFPLPQ